MKERTELWITAPIHRAVDDKTAQTLLGQSFKRQLRMDAGVGSVTFICSKTDDIDVKETRESIDLDEVLLPLRDRILELRSIQKSLEVEVKALKHSKTVHSEVNSLCSSDDP